MKSTSISIIVAAVIISAALLIVGSGGSGQTTGGNDTSKPSAQNVTVADNVQTIEIRAKGAYTPRVSIAKAGIPTVLRVNTNGTYDCSAAIRIPSLKIAQMLPPSGSTDISLGTQEAGTLRGTCGMGMYNFEIRFQ